MPDADDFDVEYFRRLLAGEGPREAEEHPAPTPRAAKKTAARPAGAPPAAKGKKTPPPRTKKRR